MITIFGANTCSRTVGFSVAVFLSLVLFPSEGELRAILKQQAARERERCDDDDDDDDGIEHSLFFNLCSSPWTVSNAHAP